jgi:glucans biosynthesis protein
VRPTLVLLVAQAVLAALLVAPPTARAFSLGDVVTRAEKLAAEPYRKSGPGLPKSVKTLTYDQYRDIRFRPESAL